MGRRDQLLRVGAVVALAEARLERVVALEGAGAERHLAAALLHRALPEGVGGASCHRVLLSSCGAGSLAWHHEPKPAPGLPWHRRGHRRRRRSSSSTAGGGTTTTAEEAADPAAHADRDAERDRRPSDARRDAHPDPDAHPEAASRRCCRPARSPSCASPRARPCASASRSAQAEEIHVHGYDRMRTSRRARRSPSPSRRPSPASSRSSSHGLRRADRRAAGSTRSRASSRPARWRSRPAGHPAGRRLPQTFGGPLRRPGRQVK